MNPYTAAKMIADKYANKTDDTKKRYCADCPDKHKCERAVASGKPVLCKPT